MNQSLYIILAICVILFFILVTRKKPEQQSKSDIIKGLYTQTARWATASLQDKSPLISVLHANYAVGYVQALQQAFSEKEIYESTGGDVRVLSRECGEIQRKATIELVRRCPDIIDRNELSIIAGESI